MGPMLGSYGTCMSGVMKENNYGGHKENPRRKQDVKI